MDGRSLELVVACPDCGDEISLPVTFSLVTKSGSLEVLPAADTTPAWDHWSTKHAELEEAPQ